jgi:hypothetical protein
MARRSGRNGRIYIDTSSAANGSATPVTTVQTFSISQTRDKIETTCFGDTSKQYIMGLGDASGSFAGLIDFGTVNWSTIADGNARKMYVYGDRSNHEGIYWFTTAVLDVSFDSGVNDLVKATVNWASASDLISVGSI